MDHNVLYNSQFYDYELAENISKKLDAVLDGSEYYDYDLGENTTDYVVTIRRILIETYYLMTEDGLVLTTEDNYRLIYV